MVLSSGTIVVDKSLDDVWAFVCDLKAIPKWATNVKRAKWTTPKKEGRGVGAKYNQTQREGISDVVYEGEVLESVVNERRATVVRYQSYEVFVTFDLAAIPTDAKTSDKSVPKQTQVTMTVNVPSNTWLQYFCVPLALLITRFTMPKQMTVLKRAIEEHIKRKDQD